jgi:catechol 2,3-dioxygenase-like lactoylglutathione lyase family enzyme
VSTTVSKINTVIIAIADQDKALAFYTDTLGLELRSDVPFGNGDRWIEVAPKGAETTIAIAPPPPGTPTGGHMTGIAFHTDDIDGYHAQLRDAGADVDENVSRMGDPVPPMFWLRDPEGNVLMVVESA